MLTNPNTLGVFDTNIEEIAAIVHARRRDALLRRRQPQRRDGRVATGRHGLRHRPLQPPQVVHAATRRRRPRLGADRGLRPHRAVPDEPADRPRDATATAPRSSSSRSRHGPNSKSIGRLRGFHGNYGCFVRSYAYIRSLGAEGLKDASEVAVLNANYLLARLRQLGVGEHLPLAFGELCMHEFVLSGAPMKRDLQDQDARPRQAAARPRLSPADRLLPAARRRGAADRADRDRDEGDARRLRRRDRRDPRARRPTTRRSRRTPRTRRRSAASTRPAPPKRPIIRQPL